MHLWDGKREEVRYTPFLEHEYLWLVYCDNHNIHWVLPSCLFIRSSRHIGYVDSLEAAPRSITSRMAFVTISSNQNIMVSISDADAAIMESEGCDLCQSWSAAPWHPSGWQSLLFGLNPPLSSTRPWTWEATLKELAFRAEPIWAYQCHFRTGTG